MRRRRATHACSGGEDRVVNLPWLNRVDHDWLRATVADCGHVFTPDNHYSDGGQGAMICTALAESGIADANIVHRLRLIEIPLCGTYDEVLAHHGLDAASLARTISRAAALGGASGTGA